ncbi:MAG: CREA protein [Alphaproteobacteria bacterium]|nr:CREA protein [Hyphomonas sp.]MBR9808716.1 CREA protein [Alphaproteobacteria bacterium]|tara:strand:- start:5839 stop:6333 length:495 start_codon:yes stop_codon:yes gene_type:complete
MKHITACLLLALIPLSACGNGKEVGEFKNDWLGNEIKIKQLHDPKIEGVVCHLSYFDRGVWDRIGKGNWFENPSNSSIACLQSGPIRIGRIDLDKSGEEVFDQNQSLIFKQLAVRRIYDADTNSLIYVSYSRKIVDGSAKMSLSTVPLYGQDVVWQNGKPAPRE